MISDLAERAVAGGRLAIDTEFVSERRYQALLCLAQVAVPDRWAIDEELAAIAERWAIDPDRDLRRIATPV